METTLCIINGLIGLVMNFISADIVSHRLEEQKYIFPQEKVYVKTDAEEYAAGDTINMKVMLMDALSHQHSGLSKYVYIELTNPFGETCKRIKIKNTGESSSGYITLPHDMAEGIYTLTGYSLFMKNNGKDFFFSKPLYIYGNGRIGIQPSFIFTKKNDESYLTVKVGNDSKPCVIELLRSGEKSQSSLKKKSFHTFKLKANVSEKGVALVKIGNYRIFVPLPSDSSNLSVSIRPEGGFIVADTPNRVGIRIRDKFGRGKETKGYVVNKNGDSITSFETDRYGYGCIIFIPELEEEYKAIISGSEYKFPQVTNNHPILQVNTLSKNIINVTTVGNVPDDAVMLIQCRGNLNYYGIYEKRKKYLFDKADFTPGVNEILLLNKELDLISRRLFFIMPESSNDMDWNLLLNSDINDYNEQLLEKRIWKNDPASRIALDNIMISSNTWNRYNILSVIKGIYDIPSEELEIGGVISGYVKSRWKGSPLKDASVSIISKDINYGNTVSTDSNGYFEFNGLDWPDGTKFVMKVTNEKGNYEDNYTIDDENFPIVNTIVPYFEGNVYEANQLVSIDISNKLYRWLDEVEVTANVKSNDNDDITEIYKILGGRFIDQEYFDSRAVTTYEEALRAFPGILIKNGNVTNNGKEVELWVDGVKWEPAYKETKSTHELGLEAARKAGEQKKANIMTGGLLPPDIAMSQYASQQSPLSDLKSSYPFDTVDKIIYLRSSSALVVSNHAAFEGGALMIYTKNENSIKNSISGLHLKVISPLGYQN